MAASKPAASACRTRLSRREGANCSWDAWNPIRTRSLRADGGRLVRSTHRLGLARAALTEADREGHHAAHPKELGLPVLERAVPEVGRHDVFRPAHGREPMLALLLIGGHGPRDGLAEPGEQEDPAHDQQERVRVQPAAESARLRPGGRVWTRVLPDVL